MSHHAPTLPFYVNFAMGQAIGLLRLEPQALVLEYQWVDRLMGLYRSRIHTLHLPYLAIQQAELQKSWPRKQCLVLKAASLLPFRHVPGALQGYCWLQIQRVHRAQAQPFLDQLLYLLSEQHLEHYYRQELQPPVLQANWTSRLARLLSRN